MVAEAVATDAYVAIAGKERLGLRHEVQARSARGRIRIRRGILEFT